MIDTAPLISLPAFIIGFIVLPLVGAGIAEYIVFKQNKSPQELGGVQASDNKVIQRYYNTYRKGA